MLFQIIAESGYRPDVELREAVAGVAGEFSPCPHQRPVRAGRAEVSRLFEFGDQPLCERRQIMAIAVAFVEFGNALRRIGNALLLQLVGEDASSVR